MNKLNFNDFPFNKGFSSDERNFILTTLQTASALNVNDKKFIEIGTFQGNTAKVIVTVLNKLKCNSKFFSIDLNQPYWNKIKKQEIGWRPKHYWQKNCGIINNGTCVPNFIQGKSQEKSYLFDSVCWCFIDGCHCYECVIGDLNAYAPKIVKGGLILLHDTRDVKSGRSQWYHDKTKLRKFGVNKAIKDCSFLLQNFEKILETQLRYGMQVWKRK